MSLELAAMRWLWLEQNCLVVLEERTPLYNMGQPDVIGVTPGRYLTEIEIKRSVQDFRADARKRHRINRQFYIKSQPRQFYYLMTVALAEKVKAEIPEWAGLMALINDDQHPPNLISIVKKAPVNNESKKLDVKQCARLARMMTNHMMGYVVEKHSILERWKNNGNFSHPDWIDCNVGTYEI